MATNPLHNPEQAIRQLAKKWRGPALQRPLWAIIDWPVHFENSHTRKLARLPFVLVPTKHDGKSFNRLMRNASIPRKGDIFACWILLLELAAKTPARGYLADEDGPYTPLDMEVTTGMPAEAFTLALDFLASDEIRWLEKTTADTLPQSPDNSGDSPEYIPHSPDSGSEIKDLRRSGDSPDNLPTTRENSGAREEKRKEEKVREENTPIVPKGDNELVSFETKAAEKKEGGRVRAAVIAAAGKRILDMFDGASMLSEVCKGHLAEHAENGVLPADEKKWRALEAMRAERAKIDGVPTDDFDLRAAWLISKERLCRDLAEALDTALAKRPQGSPSARIPEKKSADPEGWREKAADLFPNAVLRDWSDLTPAMQKEVLA